MSKRVLKLEVWGIVNCSSQVFMNKRSSLLGTGCFEIECKDGYGVVPNARVFRFRLSSESVRESKALSSVKLK